MLTQAELKKEVGYDLETGIFTRTDACKHVSRRGNPAGTTDDEGYVIVCIKGKKYAAARLAVLWMTGSWPTLHCDHWDGNPSNNRWKNIRQATHTQNMHNKRIQSNNLSGLKGVLTHKRARWAASIKTGGKNIHLGSFNCPAAAHFAYVVAAHEHFGTFARAS